jgi:NADP-dependent 3-hydroxy acid dehydrogenase YdfG/acyl carrier protein
VLFLAKALNLKAIGESFEINIVTSAAHACDRDELTRPAAATLLGLMKVIPQENPNLCCRNIDVLSNSTRQLDSAQAEQLATELDRTDRIPVVAHRNRKRYAPDFVRCSRARAGQLDFKMLRLRPGGVYLINGGLGRVGLAVAGFLAKTVQAKLVLLGRSKFSTISAAQNQKLEHLRAAGGEVLVLTANVSSLNQMSSAWRVAEETFGPIHGVIHAAGLSLPVSVADASTEHCEREFEAKVHGLLALKTVLFGKQLDFCVLTSSLAAVLGGLGYGAYAGANAFMDAFAHNENLSSPFPWISVNWDGWNFDSLPSSNSTAMNSFDMTPEEGVEVFAQLFSAVNLLTRVVVSTGDLQSRIEKWIDFSSSRSHSEQTSARHPRPACATAYVAPATDLERIIAEIWEQLLGIDRVGSQDNFFELGGHSLLATQVVSRLRETFHVEVPLAALLGASTIEELARFLLAKETVPGDVETVAGTIQRIRAMTDDEKSRLLAEGRRERISRE